MGTFTDYIGPKKLIPEKKDEFVERALKLLSCGGAMETEPFLTSDGWIQLLTPFRKIEDCYGFSYSFVEKGRWENVSLDPGTGNFDTEKVGYSIFGQVCYAVNLLREFYAVAPGVATLSGTDPRVLEAIGWLNFMFGESWDNSRVFRIQELYRHIPNWCWRYHEDYGDEEEYDEEEDNKDNKDGFRRISDRVDALLGTPPAAERTLDPEIFERMKEDQLYPQTATANFPDRIQPVSTLDFVNKASLLNRVLEWRSGRRSASEARDRTDDDRAFWWRPDGDIRFSQDMESWLGAIRAEHEQRCNGGTDHPVRSLLTFLIPNGEQKFGHPFMFASAFWYLIDHQADRCVQAAASQLGTVLIRSKERMDSTELDRYCAVLANEALRKKVLDF